MAIAHVLKPAPEQGAAQLFLLFADAGRPWQSLQGLGEKLAQDFASAAIVVLQGPHTVGEGGAWLEPLAVQGADDNALQAPGAADAPVATQGPSAVDASGAVAAGTAVAGTEGRAGVSVAGAGAMFSATALLDRMSEDSLSDAVAQALPACIATIRSWQAKMKVLPEATALIGHGEGATMAFSAALASAEDGHPVCGRVSVVGGRYGAVPESVSPSLVLHLVHGKADQTVHYGHTVRAAETLVKRDADVVADIVPHEQGELSDEVTGWLLDRFRTRVPRHLWQAAMRVQGADPDSCS